MNDRFIRMTTDMKGRTKKNLINITLSLILIDDTHCVNNAKSIVQLKSNRLIKGIVKKKK